LALVAVTVNVYAVVGDRPLTVTGLDAPDAVKPLGFDVAVYPVIVDPPVAGAVNTTFTCVVASVPAVGVPIVGAAGTVVAVMLLDALDAADVPTADVAVTAKV
jgi:hypothetical protein